jgi:hypothetical protein
MSQPVDNNAPETTAEGATTEVTENSQTGSNESQKTKLSHDEALAELAKVRAEAAARRVANRDLEEKAKKWSEYEESQKTELQKLQDQLAERDKATAEAKLEAAKVRIAKKHNVPDEDIDLLVGDEDSMERLAARLGSKENAGSTSGPSSLLAGNRGKPVGSNGGNFSMDDWIRGNK